MPLAVARGERVPWLRVLVDRTGADLTAMATSGEVLGSWTVQGSSQYPIHKARLHKSRPGRWSTPRYERAVEENWERNAADVAAEVTMLTEQVSPEVVVVAGDVRARQLLLERLPAQLFGRVVETEVGSRALGAAEDPLDQVTAEAVRQLASERVAVAVDRLCEGDHRYGVSGFAPVVEALRQAQVETLLLIDDPSSTAKLWIGPEPTQLTNDVAELRAEGVAEPLRERADAAILRALAATDAELVLVDPGRVELTGGIGAVLRYPNSS
jgi:hypothetical protein